MKPILEVLMRHTGWANSRTAESLHALALRPQGAVNIFAHIIAAEQIYLRRMNSEDPFPQDFWPKLSLDEATALVEKTSSALENFVAHRSAEELRKEIHYRNSKGHKFETPLDQMLLQVSLHGEHHRGQIAIIVRENGGVPAVTDLITFVREESPALKS